MKFYDTATHINDPWVEITHDEQAMLDSANLAYSVSAEGKPLLHVASSRIAMEFLTLNGAILSQDNDPVSMYDYVGVFENPFPWQPDMLRFLYANQRWLLPAFMSSNKTSTVFWYHDLMVRTGQHKKILIVSTILGKEGAFKSDHIKTVSSRTAVFVSGSKDRKIAQINTSPEILVMNYDALTDGDLHNAIVAQGYDTIVFDESHKLGNPETRRFRHWYNLTIDMEAHKLARTNNTQPLYIGLMTGTLTANGYSSLAGQLAMLRRGGHSSDWYSPNYGEGGFYDTFCELEGMKWHDKVDVFDDVVGLCQPAYAPPISTVIQHMPAQETFFIKCEMTEGHRRVYAEFLQSKSVVFESGDGFMAEKYIENPLLLTMTAIQFATGFAYDNLTKEPNYIEAATGDDGVDAKGRACVDLVNNAKSGLLIVGEHTAAIERVAQHIRNNCPSADIKVVGKKMGDLQKSKLINWFNEPSDKVKVILGQYVALAESMNLYTGAYTVFLSAVFRKAEALQVMFRTRRVTNKLPTVYLIFLWSTELERQQYERMLRYYTSMIALQYEVVKHGGNAIARMPLEGDDEQSLTDSFIQEVNRFNDF